MGKNLAIRVLFNFQNVVFNVDGNGIKKSFDPITGLTYHYASSSNVKRMIREEFKMLTNGEESVKIYVKDNGKVQTKSKSDEDDEDDEDGDDEDDENSDETTSTKNEEKQGAVFTKINIENPIDRIFGAWNSLNDEKVKYSKATIKSCLNIPNIIPIHPRLSKINRTTGVNRGFYNSKIEFKAAKGCQRFTTNEELAKGYKISIEAAKNLFKENRALNFIPKIETASGIYCADFNIALDIFDKIDLSLFTVLVEDIKNLESKGWSVKTIRNNNYLVPPKKIRKENAEALVKALFTWEFSSNNTLNYCPNKICRITCGDGIANNVHLASRARLVESEKAELVIIDNITGVHSFNTPFLEEIIPNHGENKYEVDYNAINNAIKKITEIIHESIDNE